MEFLYFIFIHIVFLLPSFGYVSKIKTLDKKPVLSICVAYSMSLFVFMMGGILEYAIDIPAGYLTILLWIYIVSGSFLFIRDRSWKQLISARLIIACFLLMTLLPGLLLNLTLISTSDSSYIPDPAPIENRNYNVLNVKVLNFAHTQANDNYIPYRQAQFFQNNLDPAKNSFIEEWDVNFFQRTILMGSVTTSFYNLLGDQTPIPYLWSNDASDNDRTYVKFQIISHILNSILIFPAFLLIIKFFGKRTAYMTLPFFVISSFFAYNSIFSWLKSLVAFFILLSWVFLLDKQPRNYIYLSGLAAGMAYLTHDLALIYIATSGLYLLIKKRYFDLFRFSSLAILFMIPWVFVSSILYKKPSTFIYYPLSLDGIPKTNDGRQIIREFLATSPLKIIWVRLNGLMYLVTPRQLLFPNEKPLPTQIWALGIYSIPGSLGIGLMFAFFAGLIKRIPSRKLFWFLIITPVILTTIMFGNPKILGSLHFSAALLILMMGYSIKSLLSFEKIGNKLVFIILGVNVLYLLYFIGYSFNFKLSSWINNINDVVSVLGIILVIGFSAYVAMLISKTTDRKLNTQKDFTSF
ncbi:hypothetical protein KDA00_00215 [Candidatus Saccharibacteria bacterium]|nr:hypothetical protein [Candidatus Saccharibacteria bacterium]